MIKTSLLLSPVLAIVLSLLACSNSAVIVSPLYNRLDDRLMSSFADMADFNDRQTAAYAASVNNYHYWHRRTQLAKYADLLDQIQHSIHTARATSKTEVNQWMATIEQFSQTLRECHPVNFSNDIIRSLDDQQIITMQSRWSEKRAQHRRKYAQRTPQVRVDQRTATVKKWASRIGLNFNQEQTALLRQTLTQQISLRSPYFDLSDQWRSELFDILRDRDAPELDARMIRQLNQLWHLLEAAYPAQWQQNRELWADFAYQLIGSLTTEQRSYATVWIRKMARTLKKVSTEPVKEPVFSVTSGCARLDGT